jgi:hypothetical protein
MALRVEVEPTQTAALDIADLLSARRRDLLFRNLRDNPMLGVPSDELGREYEFGELTVFFIPVLDRDPVRIILWKVVRTTDPYVRDRRAARRRGKLGQYLKVILPWLRP